MNRKKERTEKLTHDALSAGFRAVDSANMPKHYYEEGAGKGLKSMIEAGVKVC